MHVRHREKKLISCNILQNSKILFTEHDQMFLKFFMSIQPILDYNLHFCNNKMPKISNFPAKYKLQSGICITISTLSTFLYSTSSGLTGWSRGTTDCFSVSRDNAFLISAGIIFFKINYRYSFKK